MERPVLKKLSLSSTHGNIKTGSRGPVRWFRGKRHLPPSLKTCIPSLRPTWWKKRTKSSKLYTHECTHIEKDRHTDIYTHTKKTQRQTHRQKHRETQIQTQTHTKTDTDRHTEIHTEIQRYTQTQIHTHKNTETDRQKYTHRDTDTNIHTHKDRDTHTEIHTGDTHTDTKLDKWNH